MKQGRLDKGKGSLSDRYAFQPGQNGGVFLVVPYDGHHATVRPLRGTMRSECARHPSEHADSSPGSTLSGTEQGFNVLRRIPSRRGPGYDITINGEPATAPEEQSDRTRHQVNGRGLRRRVLTLASGRVLTVQACPARPRQ